MPSPSDVDLAKGFPPADHAAWMALVEKVLKGADFERRLVARSADGLAVGPLYTAADLPAGFDSAPGTAPFTRGRPGASRGGWDIRQHIIEADPKAANAEILADLGGGATSISLEIGGRGLAAGDLDTALMGVHLDACPVALVAGGEARAAAMALDAIWQGRAVPVERRLGALGADPIGRLAMTGRLEAPAETLLADALGLIRLIEHAPAVTALAVDGVPYHVAGASEAQELAALLASLVAYLRAGERQGIGPAQVLAKSAFTLAVDADQMMGIAKLRAARRLIWRIGEAAGCGSVAGSVGLAAVTSYRMLARRDPWVNMLRSTIACAAAAMGGADTIVVLPFTFALGKPDAFARRIARNTQIVLMEESGLGRVTDPAGGSFAIERLTDDLARKAWSIFQEIEAEGGMVAALRSRLVQDGIAATTAERDRLIAGGRMELTGVSTFPRLGADGVTVTPWPAPRQPASEATPAETVEALRPRRLAAPFEALRDAADAHAERTGKPPAVFLASLGPLAEHSTRASWIANVLAAGGIEAVRSDDGYTASGEAARAFAGSGAGIACIVATDATYGELGEAAAMALKGAGARRVYVAGRPKDLVARLEAAGVDGFIAAGQDAVQTLGALHRALGIAGSGSP